jgi:hypothetical protein
LQELKFVVKENLPNFEFYIENKNKEKIKAQEDLNNQEKEIEILIKNEENEENKEKYENAFTNTYEEVIDIISEKDNLEISKIKIPIIASINLGKKIEKESEAEEVLEIKKSQEIINLNSPVKSNKENLNEKEREKEKEKEIKKTEIETGKEKGLEDESHIQTIMKNSFNSLEENNNYSNLEIIDLIKEEENKNFIGENQKEEKLLKAESEAKITEEYLSRYTSIVNNNENKLLSYKRRREEMINESYKAFGFSLDEKSNFKKGLSKVEKEKLIEKEKQNKDQNDNYEKDEQNQNQNPQISIYDKITKITNNNNNNNFDTNCKNFKNSFMQDAIIKKTRLEIDKEKFLEAQKNNNQIKNKDIDIDKDKDKENSLNIIDENLNLNEEKNSKFNSNLNYLSFKEKKEAILKASNSGKK